MPTETPDQPDAYAPPSLSSLSGRRRRPAATQQPQADTTAPPVAVPQPLDDITPSGPSQQVLDVEDEDIPPQRARRSRRTSRKAVGERGTDVPVSFSVSEGVRRRLDTAQAKALTTGKRRKPHLEFIFESLEAAHEAGWQTVVASSLPETAPRRFGTTRTPKDREYAGTGPETLYVRMSEQELSELDAASAEANVPDRNKLVAICLNWHLPGRKDKPTVRL